MRRQQKITWLLMLLAAGAVGAFLYTYRQDAAPARPLNVFTVEEPLLRKPFKTPNPAFVHKDITLELQTSAQRRDTKVFNYYLLEPLKPHPPNYKFPLVIVLHDSSGGVMAAESLGADRNRLKYPAFVLVPQLGGVSNWYYPEQSPTRGESAAQNAIRQARPMGPALEGLLAAVLKDYPIDPQRIYVIGCQMGGVGALGLARSRPEMIAAAFSINGGWGAADAKDFINIPLWLAHARNDAVFEQGFSQVFAAAVRSAGGSAQYSEFDSTANACLNPKSYPDTIWQWLFRQHKTPPGRKP